MRIRATSANLLRVNFFFTACNWHFSIPCKRMHKSFAQGLKSCSEYPEYWSSMQLKSFSSMGEAFFLSMILCAKNTALAARVLYEYFNILYSINGSSIRYLLKLKRMPSLPVEVS